MNVRNASTQWQGIAIIIPCMMCFAILDTTNKFLITTIPVMMVLFVRYLIQSCIITLFLLPRRGRALLRTQQPRQQWLRGGLMFMCSVLGFISLKKMPLAEFAAIAMLAPLAVTFLARFLLKEHVPAVRWACVSGGMIGALFIVRPGGSLSGLDALYPVSMVIAYAAFQILTSQMTRSEEPMTMHFYTSWIGTLGTSLIVFDSWTLDLTQNQWMLLALVGLMGSIAHYMLILAFAKTHASQLTPFLYSQIAFSTFAGWLVFQQVPVGLALLGMILIAICGVIVGIHMAYEQKIQASSIATSS